MQSFNVVKVIEKYQLKTEVIAKILFPKAKHPILAFTRILEGKASLDTNQLEMLSKYIGVPPGDLFYLGEWQCKTHENHLTFCRDDFKIILNLGGYFLTVLKGDSVVEQIISSNELMTVEQFTDFINNLILNYHDGNQCKSSD